MRPTASARHAGTVTQRSVIFRRQDISQMCLSGGFLVAVSFLDSCLALSRSRPNLRASCSPIHGNHAKFKCLRLSGGEGSEMHEEIKINFQESKVVPCLFRIKVPHTMPGDTVKIAGGAESIGNWQKDRALNLTTSKNDFPWSVTFRVLKSAHLLMDSQQVVRGRGPARHVRRGVQISDPPSQRPCRVGARAGE